MTICPSFPRAVPVCACCSSVASGFSFFNGALLLMVALKQVGMGFVDLHFVLLVSAMVLSGSV